MRFTVLVVLSSFIFSTVMAAESALKIQKEELKIDDVTSEFENAFDEDEFNSSDFSVGFNLGRRDFTEGAGKLIQGATSVGFSALIDFNNYYGIEVLYNRSYHDIDPSILKTSGTVNFSTISLKGRYYPQFSSISYNINPYFTAGISNNTLDMEITQQSASARKSYVGYDAGIGTKFLFAEDSAFFDMQLAYKQIGFENRELLDSNSTPTGIRFGGDEVSLISSVTFIL